MESKQCPACNEGKLDFIAHPTLQDDDVIAVIATCSNCRHPFFFHLPFEQMLTEMVFTIEAEEEIEERTPPIFKHLRLVKTSAAV